MTDVGLAQLITHMSTGRKLYELVELSLTNNQITDVGIKEFAASAVLPNLRSLDLSNNKFSDEGIVALLPSLKMNSPKLQTLRLSGITIGERGFDAIRAEIENDLLSEAMRILHVPYSDSSAFKRLQEKCSERRIVLHSNGGFTQEAIA